MSDEQTKPEPKPTPKMDIKGAELVEALKNADKNWLIMIEVFNHQAKNIRVKYEALISQGFSELQALQICYQKWE